MASIPLSQPPALNGTSAPSSSWEDDMHMMLNIYIHDYFIKHGFEKAAEELCSEADLNNARKPRIDAPQGLLYEWWVVFWEIFQAKSSKAGKQDAQTYIKHQTRMRNQGVGVVQPQHPMQPSMPVPQGQPMCTSTQHTLIVPAMQPQGAAAAAMAVPGMGHMAFQYTSPVMNSPIAGAMGQQRPQSGSMCAGMPVHLSSQMQQSPYGARPASRAGTPSGPLGAIPHGSPARDG